MAKLRKKRIPLKQRFEENFQVTPGCWLWTGGVAGSRDYGGIWSKGKHWRAHRLSYEMYVGPIPDGMHVLHKCDCVKCVNPDHLFLGTHTDNMRDMENKGRGKRPAVRVPPRGEQQWSAKLTAEQVVAIRQDRRLNVVIGRELGVTGSLVGMIKSRKVWRHIP